MKIVKRPWPSRVERDQALTAARAERALSERGRVEAAEQLGFLRGYLACLQTTADQQSEFVSRLAAEVARQRPAEPENDV